MQNKTFYNFLRTLLLNHKMTDSAIPASVKKSGEFELMKRMGIIRYDSASVGGSYVVDSVGELEIYFRDKFPSDLKSETTSVSNVKTFSNSKARKRQSQRVIFVRGNNEVIVNGQKVNLKNSTTDFGIFSAMLQSLVVEKICFVENLDCFLMAEQIIPTDYTLIHSYGRLGANTLKLITAKEVMHFPDYDFIGLKEYLLLKEVFPLSTLFFPSNYDELYKKYARSIKTKNGREQKPSAKVLNSNDVFVVKIREQIFESKRFLEQQALFK